MAEANKPMAMGATLVASHAADLVSAGGPAVAVAEPPEEPGERSLDGTILLDRYRIVERLGAGGMGVVYVAEHIALKKRCAIKVLADEYAGKQDIVERFLQEARAASMIAHENVVEITDYGQTPSGSVFFVMEMLVGEDLAHTVARHGPLPWERVRPIMVQICRALAAAHDKGIIHRDMKPENCFRIERAGTTDFIKVLDFGIAKVTGDESEGKGLTKTGMIFGTPEYMSPEQAQGMKVDHRADIYAVGIILYELLTGKVPFSADTFMGVLTKHMFEVPVAPSSLAPGITPEVESVILKALQKDREHRFSTMREFLAAIESVGSGGAGVSVVQEKIARPPSGPLLAFGGAKAPTKELAESRSTGAVWGLVIVGVLAAAAVVAMLLGGPDEGEAPTQASAGGAGPEVVVAKPPEGPEVAPVPDAPDVTVVVRITSNVDAEVVDPSSNRVLGHTNSAEGITIERGLESRELVLRAEGYEDKALVLVPSADLTKSEELVRKKSAGKTTGKTTKTTKGEKTGDKEPGDKPKDPPPDKPQDPPPDKPGGATITQPGDLRDPFKKRGGG